MEKRLFALLSFLIVAALLVSCSPAAPAAEEPSAEEPAAAEPVAEEPSEEVIELEYWQVDFEGWDKGIAAAIDMFEAEYPNINITHVPISYDEINEKIAVMVPVGEGPDLVNPFYGWVPLWVKSGFLAPLPEDMFPKDVIEETFFPAVDAMYIDGQLYGLPFNQSNWAILYNKDMFAEAGITKLPENFEELRQAAIDCTKRDADGNLVVAGYYVEFGTQEHILWKVLIRKNGQEIFSDDLRTVTWNDSPVGAESFKWLTDLVAVDKVMDIGFGQGPGQSFIVGEACMRLGSPGNLPVIRNTNPDLNFGSFPLPIGTASDPDMAKANQTQYWSMNVTTKAVQDPARAEAAYTFMKFLLRPEVGLEMIKAGFGGLP
ncbi:MAG: extracellular solute-binding protein, partial [Anaerolineales bacterium]|nr:extracellular solute-binding protein [Anaerolineales bacterium]